MRGRVGSKTARKSKIDSACATGASDCAGAGASAGPRRRRRRVAAAGASATNGADAFGQKKCGGLALTSPRWVGSECSPCIMKSSCWREGGGTPCCWAMQDILHESFQRLAKEACGHMPQRMCMYSMLSMLHTVVTYSMGCPRFAMN